MRKTLLISVMAVAGVAAGVMGAPPIVPPAVPPDQGQRPPGVPEPKVEDVRALRCDSVVEMQAGRASGVTSAWLSNGVRVHHRPVDRQPGRVVVTIALCGGKLLEEATTRGMTEIAAGTLDDWDAVAPEASRAARMEGRDLRIDAAAGQDAITIRLSGSKGDLEAGLNVVKAMLVNPVIAPQTVENARDQVVRELRRRAADPRATVSEAVNQTVVPAGDVRLQAPDERGLRGITVEHVRDWIARHTKENGEPIEAAIVGDISLADALRLADVSLGTLPSRARPGAQTHLALRRIALPAGPVGREVRVDEIMLGGGRAIVVRGFFGPDMAALADQRALRAMLRVAVNRLKARLVPPRFNVGADGPTSGLYMSAFEGLGMALVTVSVNGAESDAAGAAIDEELARLANDGPTQEELKKVTDELGKAAAADDRDIRYWSAAAARCTSLGMEPDEIARAGEFYRTLTPTAARDVLAKYLVANKRIGVTVRGGGGGK
jgi:predicted Zn-dependent peptidase